ncbi:hypothetical protein [Streptomyces sp. B3I8]|uniref:hypothetical protein n=1 Tax=Streptomyces sp. B3I8 TaxID=3042303 RepID=UPI002782C25E|nr:hypothetical protein [Streptomyces sp. B3I8]MDQ0788657.1 hypothetical protein [Streptomyces sp. B3I8]
MRTPVTGEVHVHYSQLYVESDPGELSPGFHEVFAGQTGGLCGAAVPGTLFLLTGLHTGHVGFTVEIHDEAPALDPAWEDVVEVSFRPASERTLLVQWAGEGSWPLDLPETDHRVRYCARGMDAGRDLDTRVGEEPQVDSYLLQFWPAPPAPDRVVRQTSAVAEYWHEFARELPPPPTPEERAETERRAREAKERAYEEWRLHREAWEWGGRLPSERLRAVGGNVLGLLRFDPDLVHALGAATAGTQRAVALLAARRACEEAGLTAVPWVSDALTAAAEGTPLPSPFDDHTLLSETLRSDPRVPDRSVLGAVPPERSPYEPPAPPAPLVRRPARAEEPDASEEPGVALPDGAPTRRQGLGKYLGSLEPSRTPDGPAPTSRTVLPSSGTLTPGPPRAMWAVLPASVVVESPSSDRPRGRISQPHFALPAVPAAADPDPLRAALDAVYAATETYGERYPELLAEIRAACAAEDEPGERPLGDDAP